MSRLAKVATPLDSWAVTVVPPPTKVPPLSVNVTVEELSAVKVLLNWSWAATWIGGLRAMPALPVAGGWVVNTSLVSAGGGIGVLRLALIWSPAASAIVTVLVMVVVPTGILALRSTENT